MDKKELMKISGDIVTYLSLIKDKEKIYLFLRDLLSEQEIIEFSRRFEVAKMLINKLSYTEIESKTSMSSTTIARISKYLYWKNNWYKNAISKLKAISKRHHEVHRSF